MNTRVKRISEQATLTGMFVNRNDAKEAYLDLLNRGYNKNDIKLLISEENLIKDSDNQETITEKEKSGALSITIGTVAGIIAGIGLAAALVIAGFDYSGLVGAGVAGTIGVIMGLLMIPDTSKETLKTEETKTIEDSIIIRVNTKNTDDAKYLEDERKTLKGGKMMIAVR
jgi:hypothetical protein